jgi:type II secretory pathway pseudopilin PulG
MRAQKTQSGYTIIETLIVLAVTGTMFVITAILVSGQIAKYQFKDGVLNAQQSMQGILNDVQTGYFGLSNFAVASCDTGSTTVPGDSDCVYVGKQVEINNNGTVVTTPLLSDVDSGTPIGKPAPYAPGTELTYHIGTQTTQLSTSIDYSNSPLTPGVFYVLYTNYPDGSLTTFNGGGQSVAIFGVDSSNNVTEFNTASGKIICLQNGNRKAALKIGANRSLNVETNFGPTAAECP